MYPILGKVAGYESFSLPLPVFRQVRRYTGAPVGREEPALGAGHLADPQFFHTRDVFSDGPEGHIAVLGVKHNLKTPILIYLLQRERNRLKRNTKRLRPNRTA